MRLYYFNPRSPYGERQNSSGCQSLRLVFQSTLPLRGATFVPYFLFRSQIISIHAPLTGSDMYVITVWIAPNRFQSTLPLRGATIRTGLHFFGRRISIHAPLTGSDRSRFWPFRRNFISIHAPLTGSDLYKLSLFRGLQHFNPRSPYGERPRHYAMEANCHLFQSTLPLRGATLSHIIPTSSTKNFNPRSPYGERHPASADLS